MNERSRAVAHTTMAIGAAACLVGAGVCGPWFADHPMDRVLIQLVFYGGWACLVGAFVGGAVGAAVEEDACGELDMGTMASVGAILGTLAGGTIGTALTGLSLIGVPWAVPWGAAVAAEGLRLWLGRAWPYGLVRSTGLDARGRRIDPAGALLPDADQPLRMRDRVAILVAVGAGTMLALTLAMAGMMGTDLGHPVMMAPMMYGMFGAMLGGMVGGWLAGLLDEHRGAPEHDNPVMVASMALMAGMMGGMPSGMIGGMMAVMGAPAIALTVGAGLALIVAAWAIAVRGRYSLVRDPAPAPSAATIRGPNVDGLAPGATPSPAGGATLRLSGLTCGACVGRVERGLGAVPGVVRVEVDLPTGTVVVAWGDGFAGIDAVHAAIDALGYARLAG